MRNTAKSPYELSRTYKVPITIRLTKQQKERLNSICAKEGCTISAFVRYCIEKHNIKL